MPAVEYPAQEHQPLAPHLIKHVLPTDPPADRAIFPDGLKTSGQHPPIYELLKPYSEFPKEITGPTVWRTEDYKDAPDRWTHRLVAEEITELGKAADDFLASGKPLTAMEKSAFPLPTLGPFFQKLRHELIDGRGFILFKGVPVDEWGKEKSACAYLGLGSYFGYYTSQNGKGHILGHVKNLAEDESASDVPIRIYRTAHRQHYHVDGSDLVGLLCLATSRTGGESGIVSTHHLYNVLQKEHPEVIETMTKPIWYNDRKGEQSVGEDPWYRTALFMLENDPNPETRRVWLRVDPMFFVTLARFNSGPNAKIPPLSPEQTHALNTLEATAQRLALHMVLEPGDIQLLANSHILHSREAYTDWAPGTVDENGKPRKQRQLMRLWLSVPETEGGWKIPFFDSKQKKRGGTQVNDTPPKCPLDAE